MNNDRLTIDSSYPGCMFSQLFSYAPKRANQALCRQDVWSRPLRWCEVRPVHLLLWQVAWFRSFPKKKRMVPEMQQKILV